ncbi:MAG: hypothetical protein E2O78_09540 [Caldithrix sp.]|nr:MAG: hypothetical protein E2O78_09540 [Caldithrix sp.]
MQKIHTFLIAAVFSAGLAAGVTAEDSGKGKMDWPQWRGPNRDGISSEKGLLKTWPEGGPKILWRAASGDGYSAMSVVEGRLYTIYGRNADELVVCLDAGSGDELWRYRLDSKFTNQYGHGPRSTPTVDGNIVYALGAQGKLVALNAVKGARVWTHDLRKEYGAKIPVWGVSTSPMVYRDLLLVDVGGRNGHGFVAFNKKDGKVVWKAATALPGYSAPIAVEVNGVAQILNFTGNSLISVDPKTGRQFWRFLWETSYDINAATPVFVAPDKVMISSGSGHGAALLKMIPGAGTVRVEEVWQSRIMRNKFSSSVLFGEHIYGFDEGTLKCFEVLSQEQKWSKRGFGQGAFLIADGQLILLSERGKLVLIEATPDEYRQRAEAQLLRGRCWTVPTLSNGVLYIRNQKNILAIGMTNQAL